MNNQSMFNSCKIRREMASSINIFSGSKCCPCCPCDIVADPGVEVAPAEEVSE